MLSFTFGKCRRCLERCEGEVMKIVVIGGTGLIGSKVVEKLKQKGHAAIAAAPNTGVNTITGEGLKEAMAGAQVVIDLANSPYLETRSENAVESMIPPFHPS